MNVLLDIMGLNEDIKENYLVIDNCTIHKSKHMMREIPLNQTQLNSFGQS
jgi:hypothetical protein